MFYKYYLIKPLLVLLSPSQRDLTTILAYNIMSIIISDALAYLVLSISTNPYFGKPTGELRLFDYFN